MKPCGMPEAIGLASGIVLGFALFGWMTRRILW